MFARNHKEQNSVVLRSKTEPVVFYKKGNRDTRKVKTENIPVVSNNLNPE